jgi:hypothetical protein
VRIDRDVGDVVVRSGATFVGADQVFPASSERIRPM